MNKKVKLAVLLSVLCTCALFLIINDLPQRVLVTLLPTMNYQRVGSVWSIWSEEVQGELLPVFAYPKEDIIVARREDCFILKKIKPVELLTMMEVENIGDVGEVVITPAPTTSVPETTVDPVNTSSPVPGEPTVSEVPTATPIAVMAGTFVPHSLQAMRNMEELSTYETRLKNFYIVYSVKVQKNRKY